MPLIQPLLLLAIILVEGYVSVAIEILTMRQLMPFVGSSVVVNSLIIGIFLLFLAIGYYRGGQRQGNHLRIMASNFLIAMGFIAVGLSYPAIEYGFEAFVRRWEMPLGFLVLYLLLITAPLIYFLGQTVPIATNLFRSGGVSAISGGAMFLSTIGSFLGSVLTSLWLMNTLGVAMTVMITFALLALLTLAMSSGLRSLVVRLALLVPLFGGAWALNLRHEREGFLLTNEYSGYQLFGDQQDNRYLAINRSWSSKLAPDGQGSFWYIERIRDLLKEGLGSKREVLALGAGGFTLSLGDQGDNRYTYVDIDPAIQGVVARDFNPQAAGEYFVAQDARVFLRNKKEVYDLVLSDVYTNRYALPPHLTTVEYITATREAVRPGGMVVFNILMRPDLGDAYSRSMDATIRRVFPQCLTLFEHYAATTKNMLYLCRRLEAQSEPYTDDRNRVGMDSLANLL